MDLRGRHDQVDVDTHDAKPRAVLAKQSQSDEEAKQGLVISIDPLEELIVQDRFPRFRFGIKAMLTDMTWLAVGTVSDLAGQENGFHKGVHATDAQVRDLVLKQSGKINTLTRERDAFAAKAGED